MSSCLENMLQYYLLKTLPQYYTSAMPAGYLACPAVTSLLSSAAVTLTIAGSRGEGNREED